MSKKFNPHKYTYHFNIGKNIKLGDKVASWSTLKGDEVLYIPRLNKRVRGTCRNSKFCTKECYVNKSYNRYPKTAMMDLYDVSQSPAIYTKTDKFKEDYPDITGG